MKKDLEHRKVMDDFQKTFQTLRGQERFAGINYQLLTIEEKMILDFQRTIGVNHPGDKGTVRENLVRDFLVNSEYLPKKYAVSKGSSHVISTTGHISSQIDLLVYDYFNTPKLLTIDDVQYFPVESVYGTIEVKSDLNSKETLFDALNKIRSFKELKVSPTASHKFGALSITTESTPGFGIVFAYDASLKWGTIIENIKEFQSQNPSSVWPNLIVILNQGIIAQLKEINQGGVASISVYSSQDIASLKNVNLVGQPQSHSNLLNFYLILMDLLNNITLAVPPLRKYVNLDTPVGKHSYNFGMMGGLRQVGNCEKHGEYLKKISEANLEKIITACKDSVKTSWNELLTVVFKQKPIKVNDTKDIKLYNPENHPIEDLLTNPDHPGALLFDELVIDGEKYWVPIYYSIQEKLIDECPKCIAEEAKKKT